MLFGYLSSKQCIFEIKNIGFTKEHKYYCKYNYISIFTKTIVETEELIDAPAIDAFREIEKYDCVSVIKAKLDVPDLALLGL